MNFANLLITYFYTFAIALSFNSIFISWGTRILSHLQSSLHIVKRYALRKNSLQVDLCVGKTVIHGRRCKSFFCRRQKPIYSNVKSKNFVCPLKRIFSFCYVMQSLQYSFCCCYPIMNVYLHCMLCHSYYKRVPRNLHIIRESIPPCTKIMP